MDWRRRTRPPVIVWPPVSIKLTSQFSALFKTDYNYLDFSAYPADPAFPVPRPNDEFNISANADLFARFLERYRERLFALLPDERPFFFPFKRILARASR